MRDGGLPGPISWWAAWRYAPPRPLRWPWGAAILAVVGVLAAMRGGVLGVLIAVMAGLSVLDSVFGRLSAARRPYGLVGVTREAQPQLFAAIEQVAAGVGIDAPRRVWLRADRHPVGVHVRRGGYDLVIGLPMLSALTASELQALLAHQLAELTFPRPDRVVALAARWRTAVTTPPSDRSTRRLRAEARRQERAERALRAVSLATEGAADAAAVTAAGDPAVAARAFVVSAALSAAIADFEIELRPPAGWGLEDIDDAWRRAVGDGLPSWWWDAGEADRLARAHPGLAEGIRALGATELVLLSPRDPVEMRPFASDERRRLASAFYELHGVHKPRRWVLAVDAPHEWWAERARRSVDGLRSSVTAVLGREVVDQVELAEQFLRHRSELRRRALADLGSGGEDAADPSGEDEVPPILVYLLEDALLARGWRLEHPVVRGVLIGPHGQRVDWRNLTPQTYVDTLRALLDDATVASP